MTKHGHVSCVPGSLTATGSKDKVIDVIKETGKEMLKVFITSTRLQRNLQV